MTLPRYRRHDPLDVMRFLLYAGQRPPTAVAEARAAAYVDSRLRRAGMYVSADTYRAAARSGWMALLYAMPGVLALLTMLATDLLLPASLLTLYGMLLILVDALSLPLPPIANERDSQNIVAIRASRTSASGAIAQPRQRVVLLAPLDTPPARRGAMALFGRGPVAHLLRLVAYLLLLGLLRAAVPVWVQVLPVAYLLLVAIPPKGQTHPIDLFGSSGALAAMIATVEQLPTPEHTEVWAVALGATTTGNAGIAALLDGYPFEQADTLMIALPHIGDGDLLLVDRSGLLRQHAADPQLTAYCRLIAPGVAVALAEAPDPDPPGYVAWLHRRNYRLIELVSRGDPAPDIPKDEAMIRLSFANLEPISRLLIGVINYLDEQVA